MISRYDALNPGALRRLVDGGVTLRPFSDEILTASRDAAFELMRENAAVDAGYRKIFESWDEVRQSSFRWFSTAEQAYARFSFGGG